MNYIASLVGGSNPIGFQATKEAFTTLVICCKFQKNCFELLIFYNFFHGFIQAGAGENNSNGVNFEHHRKLLSL